MRSWKADIALVALVLIVTAPIVQILMAHQASRFAFTGAVVDHQTVVIDAYQQSIGVDYATRDGHLYSDKAPGQPLMAAPAYWAARAAGAEPAEVHRPFHNMTLWWTSLWSAAIPLAVLAVMIRRVASRMTQSDSAAMAAGIAVSLGTLLLPFGTVLFGHVMAAMFGYGCWVLARARQPSRARLAWAGLLGGLAVVTEYTTGIIVVAVGILVVMRHREDVWAYVAGGLPAVALLVGYNAVAWGDPLLFSYDFSGGFGEFHEQGFFGVRLPDPALTRDVLVGERGLLTLTPVVAVGVMGLIDLALERRTRQDAVLSLGVFTAFVCLQGGWFSVTAGASPGPRYVVAALPFVAIGVARMWQRIPWLVTVTGAAGGVAMLASIATNPLAQPTERFALGHWLWRMREGKWGDTIFDAALSPPLAHLLWVLLALAALIVAWQVRRDPV